MQYFYFMTVILSRKVLFPTFIGSNLLLIFQLAIFLRKWKHSNTLLRESVVLAVCL